MARSAQAERLKRAGAIDEGGRVIRHPHGGSRKLGLGFLLFAQPPERVTPKQPQRPQLGARLPSIAYACRLRRSAQHLEPFEVGLAKPALREMSHSNNLFQVVLERAEPSAGRVGSARVGVDQSDDCLSVQVVRVLHQRGEGCLFPAGAEKSMAKLDAMPHVPAVATALGDEPLGDLDQLFRRYRSVWAERCGSQGIERPEMVELAEIL